MICSTPNSRRLASGMRRAEAKLFASCSTRILLVSVASSRCSGGIASHVRMWKRLVGEIEVAPAGDFVAVDEHDVEVGKAARGAGDAVDRVHHQHQNAELLLHCLRQLLGRNGASSKSLAKRSPAAIASSYVLFGVSLRA